MSEQTTSNRRQFLQGTLGVTGGLTALFGVPKAFAAACGLTPKQTEGPFYPQNNPLDDQNNDLTVVQGATAKPIGQVVYIQGQIVDDVCKPVPYALVEIWQAAASGRYNHTSDTSGLKLDKNFGYWGEMIADSEGKFAFKTIIPGHYPASGTWFRPPHVHVKVTKRGIRELITQMYFDPKSFKDPKLANIVQDLNDKDLILKPLPNRKSVIVDFQELSPMSKVSFNRVRNENGVLKETPDHFVSAAGERAGNFEIVVQKIV